MRRILLLILALALPAAAQGGPQVSVNGNMLPPTAVLGSAGDDIFVLATPFLQAMGARVRKAQGHLEALFPGGVLTLDAGSNTFTLSGQPGHLQDAVGAMNEDLVVRVREMASLMGARVTPTSTGLEVWPSAEPSAPTAVPQGPPGQASAPQGPPGLVPGPQAGGKVLPPFLYNPGGTPAAGPPQAATPTQTQEEQYQSPYQRPEVTSEAAAAPAPAASPAPGSRPARPVVSDLKARRMMDFHLTSYEVVAKVKNEGSVPMAKPFQVQFLARGVRNDSFELLEAFLVHSLGPGEEVELKKVVNGHQFHSLQGMEVTFKAQIIVEPPPPSSTGSRSTPSAEGDSREYRATF